MTCLMPRQRVPAVCEAQGTCNRGSHSWLHGSLCSHRAGSPERFDDALRTDSPLANKTCWARCCSERSGFHFAVRQYKQRDEEQCVPIISRLSGFKRLACEIEHRPLIASIHVMTWGACFLPLVGSRFLCVAPARHPEIRDCVLSSDRTQSRGRGSGVWSPCSLHYLPWTQRANPRGFHPGHPGISPPS